MHQTVTGDSVDMCSVFCPNGDKKAFISIKKQAVFSAKNVAFAIKKGPDYLPKACIPHDNVNIFYRGKPRQRNKFSIPAENHDIFALTL